MSATLATPGSPATTALTRALVPPGTAATNRSGTAMTSSVVVTRRDARSITMPPLVSVTVTSRPLSPVMCSHAVMGNAVRTAPVRACSSRAMRTLGAPAVTTANTGRTDSVSEAGSTSPTITVASARGNAAGSTVKSFVRAARTRAAAAESLRTSAGTTATIALDGRRASSDGSTAPRSAMPIAVARSTEAVRVMVRVTVRAARRREARHQGRPVLPTVECPCRSEVRRAVPPQAPPPRHRAARVKRRSAHA